MVAGRPRDHDRDKIGQDMIEWAKRDDSINLNKFCAYYEPIIPPSKLSFWSNEDDKFRKAYECAKAFIAFRREEKLNQDKLHVKAFDMNATVYDILLRDERRLQAQFESELSNKGDKEPPLSNIVDQQNRIMELEAKISKYESNLVQDKP
jgi:hypothetical protein